MNIRHPAEESRLRHLSYSLALLFGAFKPGCLIYLLIGFIFASVTNIFADSSASSENQSGNEVTFGGQTLQGQILRLRPIGIEFEPTHAKGKLTIPYEKIEKIVAQDT
ncbi:MAG: hypothetical protein KJP23_06140, partial [Deltaproteobacteria bacterium]|nr:hypothetical protein [Deltaproteobacteria bacterium]